MLVPHKRALRALLQPEVSLLWGERGAWPQSAVSGLVPHRGTAGCPGGRAEPLPLDLPATGSMEVGLKADTSQEVGLLALTPPFLWESADLKAKGVACHQLQDMEGHFWCPGKDS